MKYPFVAKLIEQIAPEIGARVELEPEFEFVGEIIFSNGNRHLFRNTNLNINSAGSVEIAKDKGYTNYFLAKHGFKVPQGQTFFSDRLLPNLCDRRKQRSINQACAYASQLGFPVFVKPNNLSQGILVCKVHDEAELRTVAEKIFEITNVLLVQEVCKGRDYRIVVLKDEIIAAYERHPLMLMGDGVSTIEQLLIQQQNHLPDHGRLNAAIDVNDFRIWSNLKREGYELSTVLSAGGSLTLLDNANLSTGGHATDVTDTLHPSIAELTISISRTLGLNLCGVDIMTANVADPVIDYRIIEVNSAPGLDNYAAIGDRQANRVKSFYKQVLRYLENTPA